MTEKKIACVDVDAAAGELHKAFAAFLYMNMTGSKAAMAAALEQPASELYASDPKFKANVDSAVNRFMAVILKGATVLPDQNGLFVWNGGPADVGIYNATRYLREHFLLKVDKSVLSQGIQAMVLIPK